MVPRKYVLLKLGHQVAYLRVIASSRHLGSKKIAFQTNVTSTGVWKVFLSIRKGIKTSIHKERKLGIEGRTLGLERIDLLTK